MIERKLLAHFPALVAPQRATGIAADIDKLAKSGVADRAGGDGVGGKGRVVPPLFVVKAKALAGARTDCRAAGVHADILLRQRARQKLRCRRRKTQRLPGITKGLVVHVVVQQRELCKISHFIFKRLFRQQRQAAIEHGLGVAARRGKVGQVKIPARVVRDARRVVPAVGVLDYGSHGKIAATMQPEFLEPGHVTELPQRRINNGQQRHLQRLRGKTRGELPRCLLRLGQRRAQRGGVRMRAKLREVGPAGAVRRLCYIAHRATLPLATFVFSPSDH